jgi:hypothetical protein
MNEEEKINPVMAALAGMKHYAEEQERSGAWEGQSVGSEALDKKRREYLQVYIRGGSTSSGGKKSRSKSGTRKKSRSEWWDSVGRKRKRIRRVAKRVYGLKKGSKSERRLSKMAKRKTARRVSVKGYSYKRKGKVVRVKGHMRKR